MTTSGTGEATARSIRAFTLVELVIALSVVAILTGIAVPAIDSVQRERLAREPVNALYLAAREVRLRALQERRPYQIVLDAEGFSAARFFQPYGGREEFETLKTELEEAARRDAIAEASRARGIQLTQETVDPDDLAVAEGLRYFVEYDWPLGLVTSVKFWDETEWASLSGGEFRRWIFQPSGMCEPMRFRAEADGAFFEIEFHPLTADISRERSWVE